MPNDIVWIPNITTVDTDARWLVYGYNVQAYLHSLGYRPTATANDVMIIWRR